jgi:hypothetical protein
MGCDTTHKLTGTDYVDIEAEPAPTFSQNYPYELIEEVGWNDIRTSQKDREEDEEFRAWLVSDIYPGHLLKIEKGKRKVKGEIILYWQKDTVATKEGMKVTDVQMRRLLEKRCGPFKETQNFGYCYPKTVNNDEMDWEGLYQNIEAHNFWQIPDSPEGKVTGNKNWKMFVQMRLGNFYRHYMHENPKAYENRELRTSVTQLSGAIRQISSRFALPTSTNTFEGITDGFKFIPCDSTETWKVRADIQKLLSRGGLDMAIDFKENESFYYALLKGRVENIWYHVWDSDEFDREIFPEQVLDIRAVSEIACPQQFSTF